MCENIQKCCRICLDVESDHVSIITDPTVSLHLKSCLAMTISLDDELPKTICVSCVSQLSDFYNFQLNARCSQDWLESSLQEMMKKSSESKVAIQPLPDSEYNSDSLLEFLNNTANIEEYLNNLGKEDIPSIVNMLDRNTENSLDAVSKAHVKITKVSSPKKKENTKPKCKINMEIDVLDSDIDIVKEILMKETEPKKTQTKDKTLFTCFACKSKFDNFQKLSQHLSICDNARRTCIHCNLSFDSKLKMRQHSLVHNKLPLTCNCGKQFPTKEQFTQHHKTCNIDSSMAGCVYRCKKCNEIFKERFQLYKHAKEHVMMDLERICDICGHSFKGNEALMEHRKKAHDKADDLVYRCKVCALSFSNHREIYQHVKTHLQKKEHTRHLCENCGRSFASHASLIRHSLHHKTSEHRCNICSKMFKDVKSRDEHVLEHIEMVFCEKCGQNVNSYKLEAHSCV